MKIFTSTVSVLVCALVVGLNVPAVAQDANQTIKSTTLAECIERALANNLDIQIESLNPRIESWSIIREQGAFEPALTGQSSYSDDHQPLDPQAATSLDRRLIIDRQFRVHTGLSGRLPTGTQYDLGAFDTRYAGTLVTNFLFNGGVGINLTQPLLKNFGWGVNTAGIRLARKNHQMSLENLSLQIINSVSDVSRAYFELVFAIEDQKAKIEDLNRAKTLLRENRRHVEAGVLSPLEITEAEAGASAREEAVLLAELTVKEDENVLKRLMSRDLTEWHDVSLLPTDHLLMEVVDVDVARSTRAALTTRPEYLQAQHEVERRGILLKYSHNQLWPQIDLQGGYGLNGQGLNFNDMAQNTGSAENPQWSVGMVVTVPLGNRQARANYATARFEEEKAVLMLKRLEQMIVVEVDNVVRRVQISLKRLDVTRAANHLAEAALKAEETKLQAGTSTSFLVLQAQAQLASARSAEIRARADYSKSLVDLARAEGSTLQQQGIKVSPDY